MKKILIPLLGTLLLSFAHPSLATFYNQSGSYVSDFEPVEFHFKGSSSKRGQKIHDKDHKNKKSGKSSSKNPGLPSLNRSTKFDERATVSNRYADTPRKSRSWQGFRPVTSGSDNGSKKFVPHQWSKPDFQEYDQKFWSHDDLKKAMQCWLAPHLHEDQEFVNRHWKKRGDKWNWLHKHYKQKWQKPRPDKSSEVPLPAAIWLFGSALLGLAAIGRQRSKPG